jgi:hypothetical protein
VLSDAFNYLRKGELGAVRCAYALVYRPREGIGMVSDPISPPASVDYDLWCGPTQKAPLNRKQLHYEWHWFWDTGNGEMGNNGVHMIDICRWALGKNELPPRALSIGGRFAANDSAQTPNTQIALLDYKPAPVICEVRNVRVPTSKNGIGKFRNADHGIVIDCEGGSLAGDSSGITVFDKQGRAAKQFQDDAKNNIEVAHMSNFLAAVRSRNQSSLAADALQGHLSAGCCHLANVSHRLGRGTHPDTIKESIRGDAELGEAFERCREYLRDNGVDLAATPAVLGTAVTLDPKTEAFTGPRPGDADGLSRREYRYPFVVPQLA